MDGWGRFRSKRSWALGKEVSATFEKSARPSQQATGCGIDVGRRRTGSRRGGRTIVKMLQIMISNDQKNMRK